MKKLPWFALDYYNRHVIQMILEKYNLEPMEAVRRFVNSQTHAMLEDAEYAMWEFSDRAIFDMWEAEAVTGDPGNSAFLRGE